MTDYGKLNWSGIYPLKIDNQHLIPNGPGVYRVRIVDCNGVAVPILRQGGVWDEEGIMYIGGTTRSDTQGTLRKRFNKHRGAHVDGMRGKIDRNGNEQNLVQLWRDIRAVYPKAGLTFQYASLDDHLTAGVTESCLHCEYGKRFGEKPSSGKASLLHNPQHPWREHLTNRHKGERNESKAV